MDTLWLIKLPSFAFWTCLYVLSSVKAPEKCPEWKSRALTLLHSSVATAVGIWFCGTRHFGPSSFTSELSARHYMFMSWSWGYFAFDLLWCLVYMRSHLLTLVHHGCALAAINLYMGKANSGCSYPCTVVLLEITNPLLQIRWFLRNMGYSKTIIFTIVEGSFFLLFLFVRGIVGTYFLFKVLETEIFDWESKVICVVLYIISLGFIHEILAYVNNKYNRETPPSANSEVVSDNQVVNNVT